MRRFLKDFIQLMILWTLLLISYRLGLVVEVLRDIIQ
jgi:hypothetical protein